MTARGLVAGSDGTHVGRRSSFCGRQESLRAEVGCRSLTVFERILHPADQGAGVDEFRPSSANINSTILRLARRALNSHKVLLVFFVLPISPQIDRLRIEFTSLFTWQGQYLAMMDRLSPSGRKLARLSFRLAIALVLVPGILAAVGAIVERFVYGALNRPNFNPEFLAYAGLLAAPFLLIRWYWPWEKYLSKLELVFYLLHTGGFVAALLSSTIVGSDTFYSAKHIRDVFHTESFMKISNSDGVYNWLNATLTTVYDDSKRVNGFSRELPGRMSLLGAIRIIQARSKVVQCHKRVRTLGVEDTRQCYQAFSRSAQDQEPYTLLNFSYFDPWYVNYPGKNIYASDLGLDGALKSYPLAGHWIMLNPDMKRATALKILNAIKENGWIDHQTQMISIDFTVVLLDFPRPTITVGIFMLESTSTGTFVPNAPNLNFNFLDTADSDEGSVEETPLQANECKDVTQHRPFFIPVFLGMLPGVIYILFTHALMLAKDYRSLVFRAFTFTEFGWVLTIMLSIAFRWRSVYLDHCDFALLEQPVYGTNETLKVFHFEFLPISQTWFESRRVLGMALFLHMFNFLKFLILLPALGSLVRTLTLAFKELASFSLSFLVVFMAFVCMFYIIFSIEAEQYQSIPRCVATLWLGMLGELELTPELWRVKDWTIPMVILFTFISVFVLLTVIVAIISDAHERTQREKEKLQEQMTGVQDTVLNLWKRRPSRRISSTSLPNGLLPKPGAQNDIQLAAPRQSLDTATAVKAGAFWRRRGTGGSGKQDQASNEDTGDAENQAGTPAPVLWSKASRSPGLPKIDSQDDSDRENTTSERTPLPGMQRMAVTGKEENGTDSWQEETTSDKVPLTRQETDA